MTHVMILRLSLDLPEYPIYVRTVRLLSRCLLEDISVIKSTINDVENIVGELCCNVVRHALSSASHFQLNLEYYQSMVVITVTDTGQGFDIADVPPVGTVRSDWEGGERVGGYGMSMLVELSDRLDFTSTNPHGTTVRVEKNLIYESPEASDMAKIRDVAGVGDDESSVRNRIQLLNRS